MDEKEMEQVADEAQQALALTIPWWGKILLFLVKFLPLPPWLKAVLPIIIGIIEALPANERREAKAELTRVARAAHRSGDAAPVLEVAKRYCQVGIPGCPPGLVRE